MPAGYTILRDKFTLFRRKAPSSFDDALNYWNKLVSTFPQLNEFTKDYAPNLKEIPLEQKFCSLVYLLSSVQPHLIMSIGERPSAEDQNSKTEMMHAAIYHLGKELFPKFDWKWSYVTHVMPEDLEEELADQYRPYLTGVIDDYCRHFDDSKLLPRLIALKAKLFESGNTIFVIFCLLGSEKEQPYKGKKGRALLEHITTAGVAPLLEELAERITPISSSRKKI